MLVDVWMFTHLLRCRGLSKGSDTAGLPTGIPSHLGLKGFVKNNYDDTVHVEVEGDRSLVEELINQLKLAPRSAQVKNVIVEWSEPKNLFLGFSIK